MSAAVSELVDFTSVKAAVSSDQEEEEEEEPKGAVRKGAVRKKPAGKDEGDPDVLALELALLCLLESALELALLCLELLLQPCSYVLQSVCLITMQLLAASP